MEEDTEEMQREEEPASERERMTEKWKEKEDTGGGKDRREEGTWREGDTARATAGRGG